MRYKNWYQTYKLLKKVGISIFEVRRLLKAKHKPVTTYLFNTKIEVNDAFWYLFGLEELFIDQMYMFTSETNTPRIIDCGANTGLSIIFFKRLFPNANIIAFEPDEEIFAMLKNNIAAFCYTNVELVNKAVWTTDTSISFLASGGVGGRIVVSDDTTANTNIALPAFRLKTLLDKPIDFLKIDIEGAEYDVLTDCADMLHNVKNIFIEYHSCLENEQKLDEILKILTKAGFKYYIKEAWNNQPRPYVNERTNLFDLQLCIFGYRV